MNLFFSGFIFGVLAGAIAIELGRWSVRRENKLPH